MAGKRLSMRRTREILRQKWALGRSHREVARSLGVSTGAISAVLARAKSVGLSCVPASKEGKSATKKCRQEIEQSPHRARSCAISKRSTSLILSSGPRYYCGLDGQREDGRNSVILRRPGIENAVRPAKAGASSGS